MQDKLNPIDIKSIAYKLNLNDSDIELFGNYKAKINLDISKLSSNEDGELILISSINPTKAGEGKTTVAIGLCDSLNFLGESASLALREPSLGPVMGLKGGATGGGFSSIYPSTDINLHFTGDFHAITSAHNLISSVIDNHLYWGNELNIDPEKILWPRVLDISDRALRSLLIGVGSKVNGVLRADNFIITAASEIMALMALTSDIEDLRLRLDRLALAYTKDGKLITLKDLNATGAVIVLLKEVLKPNLVQTMYNNPAFIHIGPFANIAHGCSSLLATKLSLKLGKYTITEAGFGADLGFEKFVDIKARFGNLKIKCCVLVITLKALKQHCINTKASEQEKILEGVLNLEKHIETVKMTGLDYVLALNIFGNETSEEINTFLDWASKNKHTAKTIANYTQGAESGVLLAQEILKCKAKNPVYLYETEDSIQDKIYKIATKSYGAKDVKYSKLALEKIEEFESLGYKDLLVCISKTPSSLSDNPLLLGRPTGFTINIKDLSACPGAGFIVALSGDIIRMPGLPKKPLLEGIDIVNGEIVGV
ncbi:MAG: formate--tetrahydrofolate ligase [Psittacicella sp.]